MHVGLDNRPQAILTSRQLMARTDGTVARPALSMAKLQVLLLDQTSHIAEQITWHRALLHRGLGRRQLEVRRSKLLSFVTCFAACSSTSASGALRGDTPHLLTPKVKIRGPTQAPRP